MRAQWVMVIVAVCLVVTVAAIAYAAGMSSAPEVIRAQRFELVDAEGKVRGALGIGRGQPVLAFADEAGKTRVLLGLSDDGTPGLGLADAEGEVRAVVRVGEDGRPRVDLRNEGEKTRAVLELNEDGSGALRLFGEDGEVVWEGP